MTYAPAGYVSHDLEAEGFPCSVRFANFANTLSVGTSTGVVQLWDVKTRKVKKTFQVGGRVGVSDVLALFSLHNSCSCSIFVIDINDNFDYDYDFRARS